ncbi:MAG: FAD/NAD(P)-binding protein [Cyanobacteria bacterium P01_D01_bin.105]
MGFQVRIVIAGAGISGFATLGYLVEHLREIPAVEAVIYLLQPPREICAQNLTQPQRDRLTQLKAIGLDPSQLFGGGQVYHPMQPSLFTFNGNSAARGFNFVHRRYDFNDYFEWVQANRDLLASLYPDFAPEQQQQRHDRHTLDDIEGTTPRGAYGLYLHDQFLALQAHLPAHIKLKIIPEALKTFSSSVSQATLPADSQTNSKTDSQQVKQPITVETETHQLVVDYLIEATGHRYAKLRPEWDGQVFNAYPCDRYGPNNLPNEITVVGAGPAGIEIALHALHNLNVKHVTLVSQRAQSRLPQIEPTEHYECQWFTRENMLHQPTAAYANVLLQKELEACYQACDLPYPGWDALLNITDYPSFLSNYLKATKHSPNHPLAYLVRPVMSFYGQIKDFLPTAEQIKVQQLIARVRPLFATQSLPCAELMLAALKAKQLQLLAGEFLLTQPTPTILQPGGHEIHPNCVILATGFEPSIPNVNPQVHDTHYYPVLGTSLSEVHKRAADVARIIVSGCTIMARNEMIAQQPSIL